MGAVIGGATGGILSGIFGGWGRRRRNAKRRRQEEGYNAQWQINLMPLMRN